MSQIHGTVKQDKMKNKCALLFVLMAAAIAFGGAAAEARDFVSVRSACLGDGWFSYRVRMTPNAFFSTQIMAVAGTQAFPGRIDNSPPPEGWNESAAATEYFWNKDNQVEPHELPLEFTLMLRSSSSGFRTETNFMIGFLLWFHEGLCSPSLSENVAGFVRLPALTPCDPLLSDGSPPELSSGFEYLPDPKIVELGPDFLRYSWPTTNTVVIEASPDLQSWSNLVRTVGHGGTTTWSAAQSMDTLGRYFRVGLMATEILPDPAASPAPRSSAAFPVFNRLTPRGLIADGPGGPRLIPAEPTAGPCWQLPVALPR